MSTVPVKPLTPVGLHPIRRNLTSTTTLKSQAMLTAVPSKHIIGLSTYNRCFEFKSWSQMRNPAFLSHRRRVSTVVASAGNITAPSSWESWMPDKNAAATTLLLSDVIWPAAEIQYIFSSNSLCCDWSGSVLRIRSRLARPERCPRRFYRFYGHCSCQSPSCGEPTTNVHRWSKVSSLEFMVRIVPRGSRMCHSMPAPIDHMLLEGKHKILMNPQATPYDRMIYINKCTNTHTDGTIVNVFDSSMYTLVRINTFIQNMEFTFFLSF
ncbi:uncharacterized protein BNAA06G22230D isoform X1 [Brassica napus]|uniref:uncharacterized protein BNAA06G22230D isoform X1 n=1 Tax=Brassica napus TaxID=3708 RepID=UPI002078E3CB|nr:uncharacterized protein BNAA06G22230D isoform X1 [Brassica napus]XP_048637851.1 uncharacterized protein BNAA06G22230D isoform X1 [Brassica napus]